MDDLFLGNNDVDIYLFVLEDSLEVFGLFLMVLSIYLDIIYVIFIYYKFVW